MIYIFLILAILLVFFTYSIAVSLGGILDVIDEFLFELKDYKNEKRLKTIKK